MKIEDGIGNVGRRRGMWVTGSRNAEANEESLRSLEVAGGTSAEGREGQGMSSARGDTGKERGRYADHLTPQSLIVIHKDYIGNISKTEARPPAKSYPIAGKNKTRQKIIMTMQ
jgi:hypothetical protein